MSRFIDLIINVFRGMNSYIAESKLPTYILQLIVNLELTQRFGYLRKRTGNKKIIDTGITDLKNIGEFDDLNGGIQLLIQDGTGLKESVVTAGVHTDPSTAIANDERTSGSLVDEMYPIVHNNVLRSPAGVVSSAYRSFWYGYIKSIVRYKNSSDPITIVAGKYLDERYTDSPILNKIITDYETVHPYAVAETGVADSGIEANKSIKVYFLPVFIDGQRGTPEDYHTFILGDYISAITMRIQIPEASESNAKRVKAIDVFIAEIPIGSAIGVNSVYPAYFLERISLEEDGEPFLSFDSSEVTLDNTPASEKITVANYADWLTFNSSGSSAYYYIHDKTNDEYYRITGRTINGTDVEFTTTPVCADSGSADIEILSRWYKFGTNHEYAILYDNYHKKLGSEMYAYINAPNGDIGLDDYTHKYGCIAGNRYVGFGFIDGFGYYSPPYYYDALYAQNILKPVKTVVGCVSMGNDVIAFYQNGASRFSILSNTNVAQDNNFLDIGLVGQKALFKLSDNEVAIMSYKGPYMLFGRERRYIGKSIKTWFVKTGSEPYLSETTIETCVVSYNYLKNQIDFAFQDSYVGDSGDYPNGITFVFDVNAYRENLEPWTIKSTNATMNCATLSEGRHMLTGSTAHDIYDWNHDSPDETFATKLKIKLLKNDTFSRRKKMLFGKMFADIITNDTPTANIYFDESASATISSALNTDGELPIQYIKESMELEITTPSSANDVEHRGIGVKLLPRNK